MWKQNSDQTSNKGKFLMLYVKIADFEYLFV